jgi:retron-type reverse transcriptase
MKRKGGLWERIISLENLREADRRARKGKGNQPGVVAHDKNSEANLQQLHIMLRDQSYRTSPYTVFPIWEPKERLIYRLPYFPDRIVHWAVMLVLEPIFMAHFTADTYSCVKGRGIHGAARAVKRALRDEAGTQYCLKLDIRKFYPSVNHQILKNLLRRKLKDERLLWLLDEIIDSADGLPIGNYLSQYLANYYLTAFDRWLKQDKHIHFYFRYADDLVILAPDKPSLHQLLAEIHEYLWAKLKLQVKDNYQIFPVAARGIDFVGYVFFHTYTLLRKGIKQRMARALAKKPSIQTFASYYGWVKHCNGNNLLKKLINEEFQRHGDPSGFPRLHRRQHQNRPPIE